MPNLKKLLQSRAKNNFRLFSSIVYPQYEHAPHLELIHQSLQDILSYIESGGKRGIKKLIVSLPPRHGKTQTICKIFPSFFLGRNPSKKVILAAYGASLAEESSYAVRSIVRSHEYQDIFNTRLSDDSQALSSWRLDGSEGGVTAVGAGGAITGKGASLCLIDDLIKDASEANSQDQRDRLYRWLTQDCFTRLEPHGAIVIVMTRRHEDDPIGRLLANEPDEWRYLRLPALSEGASLDMLHRAEGRALWPSRFNEAALLDIKKSLGDHAFESLYQQNPTAPNGNIFHRDKFKYVDTAPGSFKALVRAWDLAISEKTTADYSCGALIGLTTDNSYVVLDVQRFRLGWHDLCDRIAATAHADGTNVKIIIETVQFQSAAVSQLLRRDDMQGYTVQGVTPQGDKVSRALPFAARVDAGLVYLIKAQWNRPFVDELCAFNRGRYDDQVDAAAHAAAFLAKSTTGAQVTMVAATGLYANQDAQRAERDRQRGGMTSVSRESPSGNGLWQNSRDSELYPSTGIWRHRH